MPQPSILRQHSWEHFKKNISLLIVEALVILRNRADLVKDEKPLNNILRLCFKSANFKFGFDYFPALDAENTEGNRPDLTWSLRNDLATNPEECEICFALECKRLGKKTSNNWELNEQYVLEGILRFFKKEKGYGEGIEIGAMVGYIQDWEFDDILHEVNKNIVNHEPSIPTLSLPINGWENQGISYLQHIFQRSSIPSTFSLEHFWIDIRDCTFLSTETKKQNGRNKKEKSIKKKNKDSTEKIIQQELLLEGEAIIITYEKPSGDH
jgi:hypothetical protein